MNNFAQNWLDIQCQSIPELRSALFLLSDAQHQGLNPAAQWPVDNQSSLELVAIAKLALNNKHNIVNSNVNNGDDNSLAFDYLALPIYVDQQLLGIIAVKTAHHSEQQQQQILHALTVGSKWLALPKSNGDSQESFYMTMVQLAVNCLQQDTVNKAFTALITELSREFACQRVSIGEIKAHHSQVIALSNSASFDDKSNLIRTISAAMDESLSQEQLTIYPPVDRDNLFISGAHAELASKYGCGSICTIPFVHNDKIFAMLTMERSEDQPFNQDTINICEQTLALISPYLMLKKNDERWWIQKLGSSIKQKLSSLFGFQYLGLKLTSIIIIAIISFAAITEDNFRINADAVLEGKIQRTISAPMTGFINSANVRAGDLVTSDQILATMEDSDLKLEKVKLISQLQQLQREHREALADRELVQVRVLNSQMSQIVAQIELTKEQLQRTQIKVPFDGVVIEGDLSQSLGAPVERGDSLFKIAPLDGYRVILKVNERSISYIHHGQQGNLALSSLPNKKFPLVIQKVTAIANAEDGSNIFRVEATLSNTPKLLRPGMEGVGKIEIDRKKRLWIWTHELSDWLKLWVWSWWP